MPTHSCSAQLRDMLFPPQMSQSFTGGREHIVNTFLSSVFKSKIIDQITGRVDFDIGDAT